MFLSYNNLKSFRVRYLICFIVRYLKIFFIWVFIISLGIRCYKLLLVVEGLRLDFWIVLFNNID